MGLLDRLFGRRSSGDRGYHQAYRQPGYDQRRYDAPPNEGRLSDDQAIARYRYLLKTAPPQDIMHAVMTTASGESVYHRGVAQRITERLRTGRGSPPAFARLTPREHDVDGPRPGRTVTA